MSARKGVWAFILLLGVGGLLVLFASTRLRQPSVSVSSSTVLVFDVPVSLEEGAVPLPAFPFGWVGRSRTNVFSLVNGLDRAARDDRISALVLHVGEMDWGWAKVAEIRDAVTRFRDSGKPVYASMTSGGEAEYLLASSADAISIPPASVLQLDGLAASAVFLRGGLDKLGIHPNFAFTGRYKSAVEEYTRTGMSPDSRVALEALLDDTYDLLTDSLGAARGISADSVRRLLDEGPYLAREALELGLVDTLLHERDLDSLSLDEAGDGADLVSLSRYSERPSSSRLGPHIALVSAAGTIISGHSRYSANEGLMLGSETLIDALRQARTRRAVKAVVLRIDSPGGELGASDEIWREVLRTREAKPVIVSMSDYAASGGYYMALAADDIVAQPWTVTGSIGIFGGKLNVLGLYQKLGLNVETVSRGKHAEMLSPYSDFTPEEAARYQRQLDEGYRLFLSRVAEGRGFTRAYADSVGQGRVWTGLRAFSNGLVDTVGGIDTAIGLAMQKAGYPRTASRVVERFPRDEHPFLNRLLENWFDSGDGDLQGESAISPVIRAWIAAARFPAGAVLALMPFSIDLR